MLPKRVYFWTLPFFHINNDKVQVVDANNVHTFRMEDEDVHVSSFEAEHTRNLLSPDKN